RLQVWRGPFKQLGRDLIVVEQTNGLRRALPLEWTDRRPTAVCPIVDGQPVLFQIERLIAGTRLVAALAEKLTPIARGSASRAQDGAVANSEHSGSPKRSRSNSSRRRDIERADRPGSTSRRRKMDRAAGGPSTSDSNTGGRR